MPTGTCRFAQHHGPSASPPIGLVAALIVGALIIANLHAVIVTLAVVAVLAVLGAGVVLLVHSHRSAPYDAAWTELETPAETLAIEAAPARAEALQTRVSELERQLADRRVIEAPAQHLHLHGLSREDVAAIVSRQAQLQDDAVWPRIGQQPPW